MLTTPMFGRASVMVETAIYSNPSRTICASRQVLRLGTPFHSTPTCEAEPRLESSCKTRAKLKEVEKVRFPISGTYFYFGGFSQDVLKLFYIFASALVICLFSFSSCCCLFSFPFPFACFFFFVVSTVAIRWCMDVFTYIDARLWLSTG